MAGDRALDPSPGSARGSPCIRREMPSVSPALGLAIAVEKAEPAGQAGGEMGREGVPQGGVHLDLARRASVT